MIRTLHLLLVSLLVVLAVACTSSVEVANYDRPVVVDPGVLTGQLENGFGYYLRSANSAAENDRLELRLVIKAGSIHEEPHQRGYAHLVEHMAYRGTKSFSLQDIEALLSDNGLRWGVDVNALTHYGATVYRFSLHRSDEHLLPDILSLMAEWLDSIDFEPRALEKEKRIVSAELRERYEVRGYVVDPVTVSAYAGSRYENRQPAGDLTMQRSVSAGDLRSFWDRTYRPDNAVLVITGANKPWQYEPLIASAFSHLNGRLNLATRTVAQRSIDAPGSADDSDSVDARSPIVANTSAKGVKYFKDGTLVELLSSSDPTIALPGLSINLISKLHSPPSDVEGSVAVIKDRFRSQLLFSAFSYLVRDRIANTRDCSAIDLKASLLESGQAVEKIKITLTDDVMLKCLAVAFDAVNVVQSSRLTEEEFVEFRSLFAQITQLSVDQYRTRTANEFATGLVDMIANGEVLVSAWDMQKILDQVTSTLDVDALNTMIKNITESYRLVISAVTNTADSPSIEAMISAVNKPQSSLSTRIRSKVTYGVLNLDQTQFPKLDQSYPNELSRTVASLLPEKPLIGSMPDLSSVVKVRTQNNYHEWQLQNGATVILLQDSAYDHVALTAISDGGYALRSGASAVAAKSLPRYLSVNGVNGYTSQSLRKIMTEHQIHVDPYVDAFHHGIEANTTTQGLPAMIAMTRAYFSEPLVIEPQSSIFLEHLNTGKARDNWSDSVWQTVISDDANSVNSASNNIEQSFVSNDLFIQTHQSLYGSTGKFGFIFVGSLEPAELERELHGLIIGGEPREIEAHQPGIQNKAQNITRKKDEIDSQTDNLPGDKIGNFALINYGEKQTEVSLILSCNVKTDADSVSGSAASTDNLTSYHWKILSDVLAEKLRFALREEDGFVYEISSNVPVSKELLQEVGFSVRPEDTDSVLSIVSDVLSQLASEGVSDSAMHSAVARDRRHDLLDAADYRSVSLKAAQRWLAHSNIFLDSEVTADLRHLNRLASCLNEPLQKIEIN